MRGSSAVVNTVLPLAVCRPAASATPGDGLIDVDDADQVRPFRTGISDVEHRARE